MTKHKGKIPAKKAFPVWGWIALGVLLTVVVGVAIFITTQQGVTSLPPEISVAQAAQKRDRGAFLLDVREPSEWTQFHIQGATLIPLGDLPNRLNEVPKDREVVVVCRTGHRSAQGRDILTQAGFTSVTSMAGGVTEWQAQGLPLVTGQ